MCACSQVGYINVFKMEYVYIRIKCGYIIAIIHSSNMCFKRESNVFEEN